MPFSHGSRPLSFVPSHNPNPNQPSGKSNDREGRKEKEENAGQCKFKVGNHSVQNIESTQKRKEEHKKENRPLKKKGSFRDWSLCRCGLSMAVPCRRGRGEWDCVEAGRVGGEGTEGGREIVWFFAVVV